MGVGPPSEWCLGAGPPPAGYLGIGPPPEGYQGVGPPPDGCLGVGPPPEGSMPEQMMLTHRTIAITPHGLTFQIKLPSLNPSVLKNGILDFHNILYTKKQRISNPLEAIYEAKHIWSIHFTRFYNT